MSGSTRVALAAVLTSAILVVAFLGAPIVPATIGAALGGTACVWRGRARRV
jgi:hypothetical protein